MRKYTFIFSCTDNGGGHQTFEVRATDKQEAILKGMNTAKSSLAETSAATGSVS